VVEVFVQLVASSTIKHFKLLDFLSWDLCSETSMPTTNPRRATFQNKEGLSVAPAAKYLHRAFGLELILSKKVRDGSTRWFKYDRDKL
jgi:hypothetical protein